MTAAITFVHLSDLHLGSFGAADPTLLSDTPATLAAALAELARLSPPPSFVAVSGDLANRGDAAAYRDLAAALAGLPFPVVLGLGNHDDPGAFASVLGEGARDRVIDGVHVLVLDTGVPGRIGGAITEAAFARFEEALGRHPGLPAVLVMHHPPALDGGGGWHALDDGDAARLAALLARRPVAAILTGHIHLDRVAIWRGVPVVTVSGHHAATDPLHGDGLRALRGASFALCRLSAGVFSATFVQLTADRAELQLLPAALVAGFV